LDYDDFNHGEWIEVFGASSNRFLKDKTVYSFFRLFEALILTFIYGWSLYDTERDGTIACYYIFLTHWMLTIQTIYFWLIWWTSRQADLMESGVKPKSAEMPCYAKTAWVLQDIAIPGTFLVFVLYWALVVPTKTEPPTLISYFTHGVNFLVMLVDVYVSRQPYYLLHGIYIGILGLLYLLFTYIYYVAGGTDCNGNRYIYAALDWSDPGSTSTLAVILLFIVLPVINIIFWFAISQCFPQNYKSPKTQEMGSFKYNGHYPAATLAEWNASPGPPAASRVERQGDYSPVRFCC